MDTNSTNWKQKPLLPKLLKEEDASYKAVIDLQKALTDDGICNIALTGPFGAGKSSVVLTLLAKEKENVNFKFLPISLATLDAINENKANIGSKQIDNESLNRRIEYSILQQLIYREKGEVLPNSRLKRIRQLPDNVISKAAKYIVIFMACFCIVFEPKWFRIDFLCDIFNWGYWINGFFDIVALITMTCMFRKFFIAFIKRYGSAKLNHIKIAGGEIKIEEENSIFNHHLDEILYFFQCTSYNVVVIEDLDRFNTTDIFLKLRELNYLLNQSKIVGRKIKFIYAIKDDMFTDSSRTKFFDYITTVIPVISPYNSKDILRNALVEQGHECEVSDKTIKEVAFFIDDMRLLQNIVNEYHQYRLRLGCGENHKIDNDKLLAIIVYKNYYPRDFSLLPMRDGEIYSALCPTKKREYMDIALNGLRERKESLLNKKRVYVETKHLKEVEIRKIYVYAYLKKIELSINVTYRVLKICVNNVCRLVSEYWESADAFNALITQNAIKYIYAGGSYNGSLNVSFSEIEKEIDLTLTYQERIDALSAGEENIKKEEYNILLEESLIYSYPINKLIVDYKIYNEDCYKQLNLSDMADRFIRIGLISEDYYDYISYFYQGMVSANDHNLILDMKLDRKPDYRIHIDNVKTFLDEIPDDVFITQSIYNFDLLDYLASNKEEEEKRYNLFINQIFINQSLDFVSNYYKEGKETSMVLTSFIHKGPQKIWNSILKESNDTMFEIWFKYCSLEHIKDTQIKWINSHYEFLSSIYSKLQNDKKEFLVAKVKYNILADDSSEMLSLVVMNNCYEISNENMPIIIKYKKAFDNLNLLSLDEQKLALHLKLVNPTWKNISLYFENIGNEIDEVLWKFIENNVGYLGCLIYNGKPEAKALLFKQLLGNNKLSYDAYQLISCSFNKEIFDLDEDLKQLEDDRLCCLIENDHIEYSENNISFVDGLSEQVKCNFIEHHKSHFVADIDKYTYNEIIALKLLQSSKLSLDDKALILTKLNSTNVTMTSSLADEICKLLRVKVVDFDYILLKKAVAKATNKENALKVVVFTIGNNETNSTLITELLLLLGEPYSKITENGKRPIIQETSLNKCLLDILVDSKYISSYSGCESGYRVNTKQRI